MKIYNIIICCFSMLFGYAQNYTNEPAVNLEQEKMIFIDYTSLSEAKALENSKNVLLLSQVGNNNYSNIKIKALKSDVDVLQLGNRNSVEVDVRAKNVKEKIVQIGNDNTFQDYNRMNLQNHKVNIFQKGNGQSIYMNGSNSVIEKITIKQTGDDKMMIINNY